MAGKAKKEPSPLTSLWNRRSVRLQMALLLMLAFLMLSLMRGNLGMALMCMVAREGPGPEADYNTALQVHWSASGISLMHMCFYAGIFVCTFRAQNYAQRFGPKAVISAGLVMNVLCTWAVPLAVYWLPHFLWVAALRFGMGVSQGFFIPCASMLIAKWFPEGEKSLAMAIFTTGNQLGIAVAMYSTAELCKLPVLAGWPTSFFLYGLVGILYLFVWHPLATDKPRESKRISVEELTHIDGIGTRRRAPTLVQRTPYKKLLFSPVVLAICMCSFAQSFVFVAMISYLPEFFRSVLGLDLTSNGIWSALPFLVQMLSKLCMVFLAGFVRSRGRFSHQFIIKMFNLLASFGCAACMLMVSLTTEPVLMLVFLCGAFGFLSAYVPSYNTSIVCVAPPFTAAVSAYGQACAQVASILAPIIIGQLTEEASEQAWSLVFQLLVAVLVISGLFFQFFGSVKVQPWAVFGPSVGANRRIQRISEANDQLKKEEEEEENDQEMVERKDEGKKKAKAAEVGFDIDAENEWKEEQKKKTMLMLGADEEHLDFPRMHHRLSVLDI